MLDTGSSKAQPKTYGAKRRFPMPDGVRAALLESLGGRDLWATFP